MPSKHIIITGRVQGVFFRVSTKEKGEELGITGWVKNELDGSVHVFAQGTESAVTALQEWCHQGPPGAEVESVQVTDANPENTESFVIKY